MTTPSLGVLVVDDDFRVASLHAEFVARVPGFHVVGTAHSGADALELAATLRPDLVLMDIYLPDADGLSILQQLLSRRAPPAAVVISAANDMANIRSALRLGVAHYLVKPFGFAAFAERLTAVRNAAEQLDDLPDEATQGDINRVFERLRPSPPAPVAGARMPSRLAPTLQAVYDAVAAADVGLSAAEVATRVGISRATAQRSLTQLENSGAVHLDLNYGRTGRPAHRYTVPRRR